MPETLTIPAHTFGIRAAVAPAAAAVQRLETGRLSFQLLLVFIFLLYSNLPQMFPALDVVRPALAIGSLALVVLLYEKIAAQESLCFPAPEAFLLAGFVVAAGLSVFGAVWPNYAFEAFSNLVKMAVVWLLIVNTVNSEGRLRTLLLTMVAGGLFPALGSLWSWQHGVTVEGRAAWIGIFANPNEMAYSLVILIPIAFAVSQRLSPAPRILIWLALVPFVAAIYLSFSRGSLIGLGAVMAYMGLRQENLAARFAMIGLLLAGAVGGSIYWSRDAGFKDVGEDANFNERLTTYQVALKMYEDSPILGVGINCSSVAWPLYAPTLQLSHHKWLITHNTFIEALSETGTVGFLFLISFFAAVLRRAWKVGRSNDLMAALAIAFVGFLVCGMSGGYVMSWFPYLLAGAIGAAGRIAGPA
jgi:O-antigen ligase